MSYHHVTFFFDQMATERQQGLVIEKVRLFNGEHLFPVHFGIAPNYAKEGEGYLNVGWRSRKVLHVEYSWTGGEVHDANVDRQLMRYLEISVIPEVYFGDEVAVQIHSHDSENRWGKCSDCRFWADYIEPTSVLQTAIKHRELIGEK